MSDKLLGKTLGSRYEVREIIGTGGMAIVYKAYDTVLHRYAAIKVLKDELASDAEFRKRFYNEAQAVARLSHNNIVSIFDVSRGESEAEYIVMELCEGSTLKDYLRRKHRLSWQETVFFAQQVARALDHAHSRGIIHQDIKPQNIMLLRDGTAKVMDFGIASFANSQETRKVSEAIGSVHYISPEQAKGIKLDYRTDLYSLGVVMYEMLTGTMPFRGETAVAVVMQHLNTVPPKPSELVPDVPPAMDEIVMHAMCANVNQRYGSAVELFNDLERLRSNPNLYLNYTNQTDDIGATRKIRYDGTDDEATQLITNVPDTSKQSEQEYQSAPQNDYYESEDYEDDYYNGGGRRAVKQKKSGSKVIIGAAVAVLVAIIAFALHSMLGTGGSTTAEQVEVPKFIGKIYNDDIKGNDKYEDFDFEIQTQEVTSDSGYEENEVIDQDPERGTMVDVGSTVTLTIATINDEAETVAIPSVIGDTYDEAVEALEAVGLMADYREEESSQEEGTVIACSPDEGTKITVGSTVTLTVSIGQATVKVPDLTGSTEAGAKSTLEALGLELGDVKEAESDAAVGTVIGQTENVGSEVPKGTAVGITIAKAKTSEDPEDPDNPVDPGDSGVGFNKDGGETKINVKLPSGQDTAYVSVSVGGSTLFSGTVNCSKGTQTVRASFSGVERVVVTVDDNTVYDDDYDFSA